MRHLKVTLLFGSVSSMVVLGAHRLRLFHPMDQALWNALGHASRAPHGLSVFEYSLIVTIAFAFAWTTVDIHKLSLKIVVAAAAGAELLSLAWILNGYHIFFPPFASCSALLVSFALGALYSLSSDGRRKKTVRLMFGERLSTTSFHALVDSSAPLNFQGEMREATVLVCEIFNHDDLMSVLPVADYVSMTNAFLAKGADLLVEMGGYLDECDGERLRVIFGAPLENPDHASHACAAAIRLLAQLEEVNRECDALWRKTLDFRIGINSGEIVTAAYGSRRFGTFSVAGEPVEFARRLCAANIYYGSQVLIGSQTFNLASETIEVRPIELIRSHGDRGREEVYELLGLKNSLSDEELYRRELYWKGVVYYREQRWQEALDHFYAALSLNGADQPLTFYIRRIESLRTSTPALEWEDRGASLPQH